MSFNRRSFLQMLGIGGMGALSSGLVAPLFGSDEQPVSIWTPDSPSLLAGHWVVKRKGFIEKIPLIGDKRFDGAVPVARLARNRVPQNVVASQSKRLLETAFSPKGTVADAHTAFYLAAQSIRDRFAKESLAFLAENKNPSVYLNPGYRANYRRPNFVGGAASLVTIVDAQIHARPIMEEGSNQEGAFEVVCLYEQFVVIDEPLEVLQTFETYSEAGDFPIEIPKDIDLGVLLRADRDIFSNRDVVTRGGVRDVISRLFV